MKYLFSTCFLFLCSLLSALNLSEHGHDFDAYQETMTYEQVSEKIQKQLQKDPEVANWYQLTENALHLLGPENERGIRPIEFTLSFGQKNKPQKKTSLKPSLNQPLKGLRVAIDPGHMGAELARLEEKYVAMPKNLTKGIEESYEFDEGTLTLKTAQVLEKRLQSLGAQTFMTKNQVGQGVLEKSFAQWMKEDFENAITTLIHRQDDPLLQKKERLFWTTQATPSEVFRSTYNFLDVEKRADLINAFSPHVTLSCHYNLGGIYTQSGQTPGTGDDYTLFFIPGAFQRGALKDESFRNASLKSARARYEFVRLIVSEDLEQSIELAQIAQKHATKTLKLPPGDHCSYLKVLCLKHAPGIYHRNLNLCRNVHSPILYAEPLCQDNYLQAKKLATDPDQIIYQVVEIYTQTLLEWSKSLINEREE